MEDISTRIRSAFLLLAWEELFEARHDLIMAPWEVLYAALGVAVAASTLIVAARSPRSTWIWFTCLLAGLAIGAAGAILIEQLQQPEICSDLGLVAYIGFRGRNICLTYLIEESMEFLGIWLVLVAMLGFLSDVAPKPTRPLRWLLYILPVTLFVLLFAVSDPDTGSVHRRIERHQSSPANTTFDSGVTLYGYKIERQEGANQLQVDLWLSALPFGFNGLGYSIHLLDPTTSAFVLGRDKFVSVSGKWERGPWFLPVFRQSPELDIAEDFPRNQAFLVVLSVWRAAGDQFTPQKIVSSDHRLLSDRHVVLGELALPAESSAFATAPLATFADLLTLGLVDLPERARAGETLAISFKWRAENEVAEDYVQFLHFGNQETGEWWVYDNPPLGARLPTRLWYSGLADAETWEIPLPADLAPGQYVVFTGLYRASDLERLEASYAAGGQFLDARVPLGSLTIERA